jgi:hypothetical protein
VIRRLPPAGGAAGPGPLEDAERLAQTSHSALEFYNVMLERYPTLLNPTALSFWGARARFPAA